MDCQTAIGILAVSVLFGTLMVRGPNYLNLNLYLIHAMIGHFRAALCSEEIHCRGLGRHHGIFRQGFGQIVQSTAWEYLLFLIIF